MLLSNSTCAAALRVLHVAFNDLLQLPSDLGATLAGAGRSAWSVEVQGNPFNPALLRRLHAGAYPRPLFSST